MITQTFTEAQFSADNFVQHLLEQGTKSACDESSFKSSEDMPPFYNKVMYKRGQKFFNDNIFALLYSKFLGLLTTIATPSVLRILIYTKKSGSPLAAYRRYLSTVFHMCIWYQSDFTPGSTLWKSLMEVKKKHNFASRNSSAEGLGYITQKDMALTQFGFMGYAVTKSKEVGLHNVADKDLKAFVHIWRVIGYLMGIENKFNICRDSLQETREICRVLAEKLLKPVIENKDKEFINMATYLSNGMWCLNPTLNAKIYLNIVYKLLETSKNYYNIDNSKLLIPLNFSELLLLRFLFFVIWSLQYNIFKVVCNYIQHLSFWVIRVFPFLAYYQFGYSNSHVRVLQNDIQEY